MSAHLHKNSTILVSIDDQRREIPDGGLFIRDWCVDQGGETGDLHKLFEDHSLLSDPIGRINN